MEKSKSDSKGWQKYEIVRKSKETRNNILTTLEKAEIEEFEIINDETGYWLIFSK